jgi:putative membrane protein
MKKMIVIDSDNSNNIKNKRHRLISNKFFEWLLYMVCYSIVLITISLMFKSLYINNEYFGLYAFLASVIIYVLNQTIKPILFYLTLPITALTMGLFYPVINVLILYITSFILKDNFTVNGIIIPFIMAILISVLNIFMEGLIIKPIIRRNK